MVGASAAKNYPHHLRTKRATGYTGGITFQRILNSISLKAKVGYMDLTDLQLTPIFEITSRVMDFTDRQIGSSSRGGPFTGSVQVLSDPTLQQPQWFIFRVNLFRPLKPAISNETNEESNIYQYLSISINIYISISINIYQYLSISINI